MSNTYLSVQFREKETVKALGARWDPDARQWYVPDGGDLAPFAKWLPEASLSRPQATQVAAKAAVGTLAIPSKGVPLSVLLAGVSTAISQAYKAGVWVTVEVLRVSARDGHVYLELSERDLNGRVVAKAQAAIWASAASRILPEFERATGATIGEGIKLLVRAKPVFKSQYGFSLDIDAIDPDYTLGDLEARKREIRARLQHEEVFERNRALPAPWDFNAVLVVAPQGGAGLGDFQREAERLARFGVCEFVYAFSRFQGEGAAAEIVQSLSTALADWQRAHVEPPDAIAVIRGGGAVNDLAWLNDYRLARFICDLDVPVLAGIGHERDRTIVDEVAHLSFDTPSKVIAGIEQQIARRAREAQRCFADIGARAMRHTERSRSQAERLEAQVRAGAAASLATARRHSEHSFGTIRLTAFRTVHAAVTETRECFNQVARGAATQTEYARRVVPALLAEVKAEVVTVLRSARTTVAARHESILGRAQLDVRRAQQFTQAALDAVSNEAMRALQGASSGTAALMREIAGQGPEKTLGRGFAMVRDTDGKTITTAAHASAGSPIQVTFRDGTIRARVQDK